MMRINRGTLTLDGEAGTAMTILLGVFRPLTGAVFAALLYVLIEGGLITFTSAPADETKRVLFYAGLGFAAGFSERIAQIVPDVSGQAATATAGGSQLSTGVIAQIAQQATTNQLVAPLDPAAPPAPAGGEGVSRPLAGAHAAKRTNGGDASSS